MYKALSPGAIGVKTEGLADAIAKAKKHGFGGVEFNPGEVAQIGTEKAKAMFAEAGIRPAGTGVPVDWRSSEENWKRDLKNLPHLAEAAKAIGGTRFSTWIMPSSNEREYDENRRFHIERFRPIAEILAQHGCSIGLEFIGPKTLRDQAKHPFIYKMEDMLAMGREIGPNVGLLLDAWHWYTSGGTIADLEALKPAQVVYVHVNDAPKGIDRDQQLDNVRALPGETGVIDIAGFLKALKKIGYEGPIVAEPFKKELNDLPDDDARLSTISASLDKIFQSAGL